MHLKQESGEIEETDQSNEKKRQTAFAQECTGCGVCRDQCPFLESCGTPDTVITGNQPDVFQCTNCGRCTAVCPSDLQPAMAMLAQKAYLLETGGASDVIMAALHSARRFVSWGSSRPFVHYPRTSTVFWPGCSLAGMSPSLVSAVTKLLADHSGKAVGVALDCCGDPAYELGDFPTANRRAAVIARNLKEKGITAVIAGCANCVKVMHEFLPGIRVEHVLDVLPAASLPSFSGDRFYLHHPCPSYRYETIQERARLHCSGLGLELPEQSLPSCCGLGGGLPALDQDKAEACAARVADAAGPSGILTYCMGCKEQFLRNGKEAVHLLELITGFRPARNVPSASRKWINRLGLAFKTRLKGV